MSYIIRVIIRVENINGGPFVTRLCEMQDMIRHHLPVPPNEGEKPVSHGVPQDRLRSEDMSERWETGFSYLVLRTGIEPFEITLKSPDIEGSSFGVLNFVLNILNEAVTKQQFCNGLIFLQEIEIVYFINNSTSASAVPIPAMPNVSTRTLATFGERNAGRVGPR